MTNVNITQGTGTAVATETISSVEYQKIKMIDPTAASTTGIGIAANPLQVSLANTATNATPVQVSIANTATNATTIKVGGLTASGASVTENPLTVGGRAATTNPTAVTDGQVVNTMLTKHGKVVVVNGAPRDLKIQQQTTITSSTSETTVLTAVASTFLDVYGVIVVNSSATATNVSFKDSTAGTTRFNIYVPAGDTRGFMLNASDGHQQATVNNNWTATSSASVASLNITVFSVKNT